METGFPNGKARAIEESEERVVGPGFHAKVHEMVARVPRGRLVSYGDVATALGSVRVARHVGFALAALPPESDVPWHRVVNSRGVISFPPGDARMLSQAKRLADEGVSVTRAGRVEEFKRLRLEGDQLRLRRKPRTKRR